MKELETLLEQKNIKPTAMRLLTVQCLVEQDKAVSLNELEKLMHPADRITIYRTLKTFEKNGLLHSIDDGTGTQKFAMCDDSCDADNHNHVHVHFYCNTCLETSCLPKTKIPAIVLPDYFLSQEVNLVVKGTCAKCTVH
ncbi:Fur family transcriptional regulator [Pseudopedobacter beijingensis]|uniref:Fur family transcriptional regulator n=1 Tax=Pseudopedobacter beijingensis TaxID=1207056 RepID=A0ABW4I7F3_9SPHI